MAKGFTRGPQRERERARAQKKSEKKKKKGVKEGNNGQAVQNRMLSDAEIMRAKQAKANAKKAADNKGKKGK